MRENFSSPCVLLFFYSATFFLQIIRIYLKIKSRICIKETYWNNDNGPFEKHWTYAWIEIMWVNKIWVLSLLFIKMALFLVSFFSEKNVFLTFSWVSSLCFWNRKKDDCVSLKGQAKLIKRLNTKFVQRDIVFSCLKGYGCGNMSIFRDKN